MKWQIITPSGVEIEAEGEPDDAYLQDLKTRGYKVEPKRRVHVGGSTCTACEG